MAEATEPAQADRPEGQPATPDPEYWKNEAKKSFAERDAAKQKARDLEAKIEQERQKEIERNQAYKEELERLRPKLTELETFRTEYDKRLEAKLADAESGLSQTARDEYERFIKNLPKEQRLDWIEARKSQAPTVSDSPAATRPGAHPGAKPGGLASMSAQERIEFARRDPEGFRRAVGKK